MSAYTFTEPLLGRVPFILPEIARRTGGCLVKCRRDYEMRSLDQTSSHENGHYFLIVKELPEAAGVLGFFLNSDSSLKNYSADTSREMLSSALKQGHPKWTEGQSFLHKWHSYFMSRAAIVAGSVNEMSAPEARNTYGLASNALLADQASGEELARIAAFIGANTEPWRPW